jgi:spermidine dehydrogenase
VNDHDDERLGLGTPIARRDFVNGILAGAGAALIGAASPATAQGPGDGFTGPGGVGDYARSNGNTAQVVKAAHGLRDGRYEAAIAAAARVDDVYDVVVVGGGISGLCAAYEIRRAKPDTRVLVLENHPVPGGEAKQNELVVDGVRLIGPQASNDTNVPSSGLGARYWEDLALPRAFDFVEPTGAARGLRFARDNFDPWYWDEASANVGWFFDGQTFGTSRGWRRDIFASRLHDAPLDDAAKHDMLAWRFNERTFSPPAGVALDPWLDSMTYGAFITNVMGLGPAAVRLATAITGTTSYAASADAVSAYAAKLLHLPGVSAPPAPSATVASDDAFSFPGGNAAIARAFLTALIPDSIVDGHGAAARGFARVIDAPFAFDALDRPGTPVRVRVGATAVALRHDGEPARVERVSAVYARDGRLERVDARAAVVCIGGFVAKDVVRDLPQEYRDAYDGFHHAPALVANVALRSWRPMASLGITAARWFTGFGFWANIRQPMAYDGYRPPLDPDLPALLTFYTGFPRPGMPLPAAQSAARAAMFATPYIEYERRIRAQLQMLFGEAGFDARRDVAGIVLNRWGHAYISPPPGWYFGPNGTPGGREVIRRRFGRVAFGHSELAGRQNWIAAVTEGRRAAQQALEALA